MPKLDIHQESDFKAEQTSEQFYSFIVFYTSFRSLAQRMVWKTCKSTRRMREYEISEVFTEFVVVYKLLTFQIYSNIFCLYFCQILKRLIKY